MSLKATGGTCLAGSVRRVCNSSQSYEFKLHVEYRDYLSKNFFLNSVVKTLRNHKIK